MMSIVSLIRVLRECMKKERDSIPISRKARGKEVAPARKRLIRE
jgi:hypothetical protein